MILGSKLMGEKKILDGFRGGEARSTCQTTKSWIKHNKISQEPTKCKKNGEAIVGGDFQNWAKTNKIRLESEG
jgi:hypothetical protein